MPADNIGNASVPLRGSNRNKLKGAEEIGDVEPNEKIEVTVILRPNPSAPKNRADDIGIQPLQNRAELHLTREQFARTYGALKEDADKVQEFAKQYGLHVVDTNLGRRSVVLSGTATKFEKAFKVKLKRFQHPTQKDVKFRGREGSIYIPSSLSGVIQAVLGLDDRPQVAPHFRRKKSKHEKSVSYTAPQIAGMYDFPSSLNGAGECIAILEFGGGYSQSDLTTYFGKLNLNPPSITTVSVDGATNSPTGNPNSADGEVTLDIEVAGSIASGARIVMYFAPISDRGFVDAITTAANDAKNAPSIISISWGGPESTWTSQTLQAVNQAIEDAATMGITVCVAAGDNGSTDGVNDGLQHVDFPASSPYALACGGTTLDSSNGKTISKEMVWNDEPKDGATGGGISDEFDLPTWQDGFNVPPSVNPGEHIGRGVPDVSADADPETGYLIIVDGTSEPIGGTSAVAPLWAGLIALINQKLGHSIGFVNPILYQLYSKSSLDFHDITVGNNGAYDAGPGWDACTGLGSPDGSKILNGVTS